MILADSWYTKYIKADVFDEVLVAKYPRIVCWLAKRVGLIRGIILCLEGRRYSCVVTCSGMRGSEVALVVTAFFNTQKIILLQLIRSEKSKSFPLLARFTVVPLLFGLRRWSLRRALRAAQVMTSWEVDYYRQIYNLEPSRVRFIPLFYYNDTASFDSQAEKSWDVFVSGRALLDWPLLFSAARDQGWRIIVVCSRKDFRRVKKLSTGFDVQLFHEVSQAEHDSYLVRSSLCVMPLKEQWASAGQIRIANAIAARIPIVCTDIRGVEGYLKNGSNSLLREAGNALAFREGINLLLRDDRLRSALSEQALLRARERSTKEYFKEIDDFVSAHARGEHSAPFVDAR